MKAFFALWLIGAMFLTVALTGCTTTTSSQSDKPALWQE